MRFSFWWFLISFSNISLFWNNNLISAHVAFSEHILVLRQLPNFSSCRVIRTFPGFETITEFQLMSRFRNISGFETITGIHINVNFQILTHLWNKTRQNINKMENKNKLFFMIYKWLQHWEIKILISFVLTIYI